jgi:drug/metabolite transporter (DMT)-like permease
MASALTTNPDARANPVAGILWMLVSCVLLSGVAVLGRLIALEGVPVLQIVFLRLLFAAVALAPLFYWRGPELIRTNNLRLYGVRVAVGLVGMVLWFAALAHIPVGEVTAIGFLAPIFGTVGAALILHETVRWRRWLATAIGFVGALIILRPGVAEISIGMWYALTAAVAMAGAGLLIKSLTGRDDPDKVVMISVCLQTPLMAIPALMVWEWFEPWLWLPFVGLGVLGMLGHITLTRAFRAADASLVMSLEFARLPFAVLLGFILFGELIDLWTWVGAGVIFAASVYTAHRERQRKLPRPAPEPTP